MLSAPAGTPPEACRRFLDESEEWIAGSLAREKAREEASGGDGLSRELIIDFAEKSRARFEMWERRMELQARRVTFKYMTSRWGSCNVRTGDISINVRLALFPGECADYIIVHELAHLVHHDHSPAFWALVAQYIPDWKSLRAQLRNQP